MSPKNIRKLADKKHRAETGLFIVEGEKNIRELLTSDFHIEEMLGTQAFFSFLFEEINAYDEHHGTRIELTETKQVDLEKIGTLVTNNAGIAVVKQKEEPPIDAIIARAKKDFVLLLDDVRDPGNLGTIIRIADWFGVTHIIASPTTTDFYNPKTISATMGSFTRIPVTYKKLEDVLIRAKDRDIPVIVADMEGISTHKGELPQNGFLLMGSESHGVSGTALTFATHRITIPRFGKAESLNVSVATGILLDTIRRN